MPSASSESEKSAENIEVFDPIKRAIVIVEHKIRNLEKRKSTLDSYKGSIKSLTKEEVEAFSKYDEVIHHLELSKEYIKQFTVINVQNDKLKKKLAKKGTQEKYKSEINKIKEVLLMQNVLQNMCTDSVREDFLTGRNKAIQLTANDLKTLDDLYNEVSFKNNFGGNGLSANQDQFQKAAEYFMAVIEGKAKKVVGSTGAKIKELITSIHNCGYFDQPQTKEVNSTLQVNENKRGEEECFQEKLEISSNLVVPSQISSEASLTHVPNSAPTQSVVLGPVLPGSLPSVVPRQQQIIVPNVPNIVPTPVSQVESNFFNAQGFKPLAPPVAAPPNPSIRQINDLIQSMAGMFNFLQESELDLSDMNPTVPGVSGNTSATAPQIALAPPSAIPMHTFTNQNFSGPSGIASSFPPNYPPQPAAFHTFVPTFPAFVPPNASTVQIHTPNTNSSNPTVIASPTSNSDSKPNNIPNSRMLESNRNPNMSFNCGQQPISTPYPNQPNVQNMCQSTIQRVFPHGSIPVGTIENTLNEIVRKDSEIKEKPANEKHDWSQPESTNLADNCVDPSKWNSPNPNQSDVGPSNENKFSTERINRPGAPVPRSTNGYQGNKPRSNRQGGYRETQSTAGNGGGANNYQNQNVYQTRNDRNNEFQAVWNKGNQGVRHNLFKERGDYSSRDREIRDSYAGGFKRGPKGPMDCSDKQGQTSRTNPSGPRGQRNLNRQPGGRNGSTFQRLQSNSVEKITNK